MTIVLLAQQQNFLWWQCDFCLLLSRLLFAAQERESDLNQANLMGTLLELQELWLDSWCANISILASVSYQCGIIERWHWINESHLVRIPICAYVLAAQLFCRMLPRAIHIIIHFVTCPELLRKQMAQDAGGTVVCVPQFYLFIKKIITKKKTKLHFMHKLQIHMATCKTFPTLFHFQQ